MRDSVTLYFDTIHQDWLSVWFERYDVTEMFEASSAFYQYMVCIFRMHIFLHKFWKKRFFQNYAEKSASGKTENSRSCAGKSANYIQIRNLNNLCIKRILNLWIIFHMFTYFKPYNLIWMYMTLLKIFQENNI